MRILGEVDITSDGVLHGWCWSPDRPNDRLTLEILIDDEAITSLVASRFREDIRHRNFGDGYHGFTVTLTKKLALAPKSSIISARERTSGRVFWHKIFGELALPEGFANRDIAVRAEISQLAHSSVFVRDTTCTKAARLAKAFGALSQELLANTSRTKHPSKQSPVVLVQSEKPVLSVILDVGPEGDTMLQNIRGAATSLGQTRAEIILTDDGADAKALQSQISVNNLKYIFFPESTLPKRRNQATGAARGEVLVFLNHVRGGVGPALRELSHCAAQSIIISADIADAARRVAPNATKGMVEIVTNFQLGLMIATPNSFIQRLGGFDEQMDDDAGLDALDWVLRAASAGAPIAVWRPPFSLDVVAMPKRNNISGGHRFAERWVLGAN